MQMAIESISYGPSLVELLSDWMGSLLAIAGFFLWLYSLAHFTGFRIYSVVLL